MPEMTDLPDALELLRSVRADHAAGRDVGPTRLQHAIFLALDRIVHLERRLEAATEALTLAEAWIDDHIGCHPATDPALVGLGATDHHPEPDAQEAR